MKKCLIVILVSLLPLFAAACSGNSANGSDVSSPDTPTATATAANASESPTSSPSASPSDAPPASASPSPAYTGPISFTTEGSEFAPVVTVTGNPVIQWTWSDGTTSSAAAPSKSFGSTGTRTQKLLVTPWSALKTINIGYTAVDGGTDWDKLKGISPDRIAGQNVSAVSGLEAVSHSLTEWYSSFNSIQSLDFSNFPKLSRIECYSASSLAAIKLTNLPSLGRICVENCALTALDLSECPNLEDIRGAFNPFPTINFGTIGLKIWHICVRDNPTITTSNLFQDVSVFPNIRDLYIWNTNQKGTLRVPSTNASGFVDIFATQNAYTSADFSGSLKNSTGTGSITIFFNKLTSLNITGCVQLTNLQANNNSLSTTAVDGILAELDSMGRTGGNADLRYNAAPSAAGAVSAANLIAKGWTVATD